MTTSTSSQEILLPNRRPKPRNLGGIVVFIDDLYVPSMEAKAAEDSIASVGTLHNIIPVSACKDTLVTRIIMLNGCTGGLYERFS